MVVEQLKGYPCVETTLMKTTIEGTGGEVGLRTSPANSRGWSPNQVYQVITRSQLHESQAGTGGREECSVRSETRHYWSWRDIPNSLSLQAVLNQHKCRHNPESGGDRLATPDNVVSSSRVPTSTTSSSPVFTGHGGSQTYSRTVQRQKYLTGSESRKVSIIFWNEMSDIIVLLSDQTKTN